MYHQRWPMPRISMMPTCDAWPSLTRSARQCYRWRESGAVGSLVPRGGVLADEADRKAREKARFRLFYNLRPGDFLESTSGKTVLKVISRTGDQLVTKITTAKGGEDGGGFGGLEGTTYRTTYALFHGFHKT